MFGLHVVSPPQPVNGGATALGRTGHIEGISNITGVATWQPEWMHMRPAPGRPEERPNFQTQRLGFERGKPTTSAGFKDAKGKPSIPPNTILSG